jgi:phytanoyl-CoA hydroxylase
MARFPDCPGRLDEAAVEQYRERGFLAFEHALSSAEVAEAKEALSDIVRSYCRAPETFKVSGGKGKESQSGRSYRRLESRSFFQLERGIDSTDMGAEELESHIRKYMWFENDAPIFERIYRTHERIQGVVRSLLGDSVELYQSMALVKPAHIGIDKPWHQDNAYFSVRDLDEVLGTWIALDDATVENGCMHFIPGGHRLGPLRHHHTYDCEIVGDRIDPSKAVPVELEAGGIVFFHGNIPHYTPPNNSNTRRRAIQYHYRTVKNQVISAEEYFEVFKESDGTPASCAAATKFGF